MTKYVIAILLFITSLVILLLYVGGDAHIIVESTSNRNILNFKEVEISWQAIIVLITLSVIGLIILWSFLMWLWKLPVLVKSGAGLRRRNHALSAMEDALLAGAEGDKAKARKKAEKARQLINSPILGRMVSAQAAENCGDSEEAIANYHALLDDDKTRLAGQRGLAQQYLNMGDLTSAIEQAKSAYETSKSAHWALDTLFQAQLQDYRWQEAEKTLEEAQSRKLVDKTVACRRRAVLLTAEADRHENAGQIEEAKKLAEGAVVLSPDFVPASALLARLLDKDGETKKAAHVIEKAWGRKPHPALALAYRDIYADEPEALQRKKLRSLSKIKGSDRESNILRAEEELLGGNPVAALSELTPLLEVENPSARLCLLAAQIEKQLNNPADAALWLARAAIAPAEADWSDLDPQGDAFDYTDQDWRRLVHTYGETGEMIHPRFEQGAQRQSVMPQLTDGPPPPATTQQTAEEIDSDNNLLSNPRSHKTPNKTKFGQTSAEHKSDISKRLDNLLGRKKKN